MKLKLPILFILVAAGSAHASSSAIPSVAVGTGPYLNVRNYGAVADAKTVFTGAITAETNSLNISPSTFLPGDVNKTIYIRGAGASGATLHTSITGVSGTTCILADNARTTVSSERVDWGTIDVAAFKAAVAALPAVGGTIYVPAGNYLIGKPGSSDTTRITIDRSNVNLVGDGIGQTTLLYSSAGHTGAVGPGNCIFVGNTSVIQRYNLTFRDFTIRDLSKAPATSGHGSAGLEVFCSNNIRIERVELIDCKGNSAINLSGAPGRDVFIRDCIMRADTSNYLEGDGANVGNFSNVHFTGNYIYSVGRHGYEGGGNCYDQYLAFNKLDMNNVGLSGINPTGANNTTVIGNTVLNVQGYGIDFTVDIGAAFVSKNNRVIGNYISLHGNGAAGIRIENTSADYRVVHMDKFVVADNQIDCLSANTSQGMYISEGKFPDMIIQGNRFNANGQPAFIIPPMESPPPASRWMIIKDNIFSDAIGAIDGQTNAVLKHIILEGNTLLHPAVQQNRYGGYFNSGFTGTIGAGAIVSSTQPVKGSLARVDSVIIVPGSSIDPNLITWGIVTADGTVTFKQYNPTHSPIASSNVKAYLKRAQNFP